MPVSQRYDVDVKALPLGKKILSAIDRNTETNFFNANLVLIVTNGPFVTTFL